MVQALGLLGLVWSSGGARLGIDLGAAGLGTGLGCYQAGFRRLVVPDLVIFWCCRTWFSPSVMPDCGVGLRCGQAWFSRLMLPDLVSAFDRARLDLAFGVGGLGALAVELWHVLAPLLFSGQQRWADAYAGSTCCGTRSFHAAVVCCCCS